jgi:hypothetical protein
MRAGAERVAVFEDVDTWGECRSCVWCVDSCWCEASGLPLVHAYSYPCESRQADRPLSLSGSEGQGQRRLGFELVSYCGSRLITAAYLPKEFLPLSVGLCNTNAECNLMPDSKEVRVYIRMTLKDKKCLEEMAVQLKLTKSELVRKLLKVCSIMTEKNEDFS